MDDVSALFGARAGGITSIPQNSFDPRADRASSDFDSVHRLVLSYIFELPFGKGKRRLARPGAARALLGNWELAGITAFQSGRPFTAYYGASANFSGSSNGANGGFGFDRPDVAGNPRLSRPDPARWFATAAFRPPNRTFGNLGRNTLRADGLNQFDIALYKNFPLRERARLQFRAEVFNAFNTPNFFLPVGDLTSAAAGRVRSALDSRQIQLALKIRY